MVSLRAVAFVTVGLAGCARPTVEGPHGTPGDASPQTGDANLGANAGSARAERVTFPTQDGFVIAGSFTFAKAAPSLAPTVVFVHQLSSTRHEWDGFLERFNRGHSMNTLAIDMRGHGESTQHSALGVARWTAFGNDPAQWAGVVLDVRAAVAYARRRTVNNTPILLVGSSIGSSAVLAFAASELQRTNTVESGPARADVITGVAMLSPGLSYRGLDTVEPMRRWLAAGLPAITFATEADEASAEASTRFKQIAAGATNLRTVLYGSSGEHGVSMAQGHPDLWNELERWLLAHANAAQLPPAPPRAEEAGTQSDASSLDSF